MGVHAGLFSTFAIGIISLFVVYATSRGTPFRRFSGNQESLSPSYKTLEDISVLQCSATCYTEKECIAFNHHASAGNCELVNSAGLQSETLPTEDGGWALYRKGLCDEGFVPYGGSCYMFSEEQLDWTGALNACWDLGGHLAEIDNEAENEFVKGIVQERQLYWLGATDDMSEGDWRWVHSDTRITNSTFSDWKPDRPDNAGGNEHYMVLSKSKTWEDVWVGSNARYICEMAIWDHAG